ncbi:MAG: MFS transporter, partial [Sphaerospermopsis sp. SIO1G2]|nr:MFS transporter [Sphaerospermopsis sp. SIO1G2]
IPLVVVIRVTKDYDSPEGPPAEEQPPLLESIRTALSNKPFRYLIGLYLFSWTTASLIASVLVFFANYYMRVPDQANFFVLVSQLSAVAFMPFWVWMAQKFDKRSSFIWGSISWAVILVFLALVQPEQIALTYVLAALSGAGIATAYFLPWAMIPDVVEYDALENGVRREALFYAFISFFQKLGTGLAIWAFGQALGAFGYITPEVGAAELPIQPESAVTAIRLSMGLVPAILLAIAVLFAYFYPLTRESFAEIRQQLNAATAD